MNNNNEYLECLTHTGPKHLHVLYKNIFVKIKCIQHECTHTHAHTHRLAHAHTCTHTHTHTHKSKHLTLYSLPPPPKMATKNHPCTHPDHPPHHSLSCSFTHLFSSSLLSIMCFNERLGHDGLHITVYSLLLQCSCLYFRGTWDAICQCGVILCRLIDPSSNTARVEFALQDVSFWAAHPENNR